MGASMFTAVTGLQAFQRKLDVIANNISNVNTTGFRSGRALFQDLFSQTVQGASAPSATSGGTNPMQIGLGVQIGSIDTDFGQGSLVTTGFISDLAIQGAGLFVLSDGTAQTFTRDGSFSLNPDGFLIDPASGLFVQGFPTDSTGAIDTNVPAGNISIPVGGTAIVQETSLASLVGNLSSDAVIGKTTPDTLTDPGVPGVLNRTIRVFDSLGTERDVQLTFTKRAQVDDGGGTLFNAWEVAATFNGTDVTNVADTGVLLFDGSGQLADVGNVTGGGVFTTLAGDIVSIPVGLFTGAAIPTAPLDFGVDFSFVTELADLSDVTLSNQDGFPRGVLESFAIGENGTIVGAFSNGLSQLLGQVALANFSNVSGLERVGGNSFRETPASGTAQIGVAGSGGRGQISGGALELSNVDLATEFSNMIVTQRGFQANARTITAADTLLQETVNLVR